MWLSAKGVTCLRCPCVLSRLCEPGLWWYPPPPPLLAPSCCGREYVRSLPSPPSPPALAHFVWLFEVTGEGAGGTASIAGGPVQAAVSTEVERTCRVCHAVQCSAVLLLQLISKCTTTPVAFSRRTLVPTRSIICGCGTNTARLWRAFTHNCGPLHMVSQEEKEVTSSCETNES